MNKPFTFSTFSALALFAIGCGGDARYCQDFESSGRAPLDPSVHISDVDKVSECRCQARHNIRTFCCAQKVAGVTCVDDDGNDASVPSTDPNPEAFEVNRSVFARVWSFIITRLDGSVSIQPDEPSQFTINYFNDSEEELRPPSSYTYYREANIRPQLRLNQDDVGTVAFVDVSWPTMASGQSIFLDFPTPDLLPDNPDIYLPEAWFIAELLDIPYIDPTTQYVRFEVYDWEF